MSKFHFHLHECGTVTLDEEGTDHADLGAARTAAVEAARDVMAAEVRAGRLRLDCSVEVVDGRGDIMFIVPFRDAVATC